MPGVSPAHRRSLRCSHGSNGYVFYAWPTIDDVHKAIELLRKHGVPARRLFFYVLIRDDTEDALGRIRELKALGCQPFAQPYRDFEHEGKPSWEQWRLAYWCNRKPLFHSVDYEEYRKKRT